MPKDQSSLRQAKSGQREDQDAYEYENSALHLTRVVFDVEHHD